MGVSAIDKDGATAMMNSNWENGASLCLEHTFGPIYGWFSTRGLRRLLLPRQGEPRPRIHVLHSAMNDSRVWALYEALKRYFAGIHETFDDVPLDLGAGTPFQQAVWEELRRIPWGASVNYGAVARAVGRGGMAARAVGQAVGANPVPLVVPCHRVLAAHGRLGGFSCGLHWKRELLRIEGIGVRETPEKAGPETNALPGLAASAR